LVSIARKSTSGTGKSGVRFPTLPPARIRPRAQVFYWASLTNSLRTLFMKLIKRIKKFFIFFAVYGVSGRSMSVVSGIVSCIKKGKLMYQVQVFDSQTHEVIMESDIYDTLKEADGALSQIGQGEGYYSIVLRLDAVWSDRLVKRLRLPEVVR